jgi:hypothetical protein
VFLTDLVGQNEVVRDAAAGSLTMHAKEIYRLRADLEAANAKLAEWEKKIAGLIKALANVK